MTVFKENENIIEFNVDDDGLLIKEILKDKFNISDRFLKRLERTKSVFLNGSRIKTNKIARKGDKITILMEDETDENVPQPIPIEIIYEDFDLLILNKPPKIVVHPTKSHPDNTIANGVAYYFKQKKIKKKVRFVNRLDMDTSGILVIAKNPFAHQQLAKQFESNIVEKRYLAIVEGIVKDDEGTIKEAIGRCNDVSIKRTVLEDGKVAITNYKVLERYKNATLLEIHIETGRTHQIRVHLSHIGHPIIGDSLYNKPSQLIDRQALHSYSLKFISPRTKERRLVFARLPKDMELLIEKLNG
ncbi:23S rRNA pseudouridine1911/1915/1917 synthase [Caloranaerobacter azorensis DSM 13643]|uniref:Pseudouridine synthase n=1 Tax=Caloranaerobacter azorensis DSM 13643 TaxID=1121264 RepID=A0A1M5SQ28_9FIRM|nr:RluA family pseudouridine synthase [Caloranaerobacter azorensis]SHH40621.1 23S rRNA pseudouridine1911/1915/1917 synthase [Caloranaerobacter azorensis DSM 13643]